MIIWTKKNLADKVGYSFLKKVKNNMRGDKDPDAVVRFGITGEGAYPNYQITHSKHPNKPRTIRGRNHEKFEIEDGDEFNDSNLSQPFTYEDICSLVDQG